MFLFKIIPTVDFVTTTMMANYPFHWLMENLSTMFMCHSMQIGRELYRFYAKNFYFTESEWRRCFESNYAV